MNKRITIISMTVVAAFALMSLVFVNVQAAAPTVTQPAQPIFQFTQTIEGGEVSNLGEFTVTLMVAPPYNLAAIQPFTITNALQNTPVYEVVNQSANVTYANDTITWKSTVGPTSPAQSAWFVLKIKESYLIEVASTFTNIAYVQLDANFAGSLPIGSLPGNPLPGGSLPDGTVGQAEAQFSVIPGDTEVVELTPGITSTLAYTSTDFEFDFTIPGDAIGENITLRYLPLASMPSLPAGLNGFSFFSLDVFKNGSYVPGFLFLKPITLNFSYTDASVKGLSEETFRLYYFDENGLKWDDVANTCGAPASEYHRDLVNNTLSVDICHLTNFAMTIKPERVMYMPIISSMR